MVEQILGGGIISPSMAKAECVCGCNCEGHSAEYAQGYFKGTGAGARDD